MTYFKSVLVGIAVFIIEAISVRVFVKAYNYVLTAQTMNTDAYFVVGQFHPLGAGLIALFVAAAYWYWNIRRVSGRISS